MFFDTINTTVEYGYAISIILIICILKSMDTICIRMYTLVGARTRVVLLSTSEYYLNHNMYEY